MNFQIWGLKLYNNAKINEKKLAFTIVELVIVLTILVILSTMGFVSVKNYLQDGRDAKRLSDINSLYTKISTEQVLGANTEDLVDSKWITEVVINGGSGSSNIGTANREALKEVRESFLDPNSTKENPIEYEIAYLKGVATLENLSKKAYNFLELRTKLEESEEYSYYGDYNKIMERDSENLFGNEGTMQVIKDCYEPSLEQYGGNGGLVADNGKKIYPIRYVDDIMNGVIVGKVKLQGTFRCDNGTFTFLGEVELSIECNSPYVTAGNSLTKKMCVLSCTDTNDNTRNWRIVPFAKWATGNYPAPIWNSTTKSYDYPEGKTEDDYPAFKDCTDLGKGWRMPTVKNIQDMPGYYGTSGTCKNLIAKGNNIRNIYSSEAKDDSNIYIVRMGSTPDKKSIGKTAEQRMNTNDTTGVVCIYD